MYFMQTAEKPRQTKGIPSVRDFPLISHSLQTQLHLTKHRGCLSKAPLCYVLWIVLVTNSALKCMVPPTVHNGGASVSTKRACHFFTRQRALEKIITLE